MSRVGNPFDNAKAESFMKTLKRRDRRHAITAITATPRAIIGVFIEEVYNRQRLHSALDYQSPVEFEAEHQARSAPPRLAPRWVFKGYGNLR